MNMFGQPTLAQDSEGGPFALSMGKLKYSRRLRDREVWPKACSLPWLTGS